MGLSITTWDVEIRSDDNDGKGEEEGSIIAILKVKNQVVLGLGLGLGPLRTPKPSSTPTRPVRTRNGATHDAAAIMSVRPDECETR